MGDPYANIPIRMVKEGGAEGEDGQKQQFVMKVEREVEMKTIKQRTLLELDIPLPEQLLIFRGRKMDKADPADQPLCTPDLEELIELSKEGEENALRMSVLQRPFLVPPFLKEFGFEHLNSRRKAGASALHHAARLCRVRVVMELLATPTFENADVADRAGQTALHVACACRLREVCLAIVEAMDERGYNRFAAVNAQDGEQRTALHLAAFWGDLKACQAIMDHELFKPEDALLVDVRNSTALDYAVECGHAEVAEAIKAFNPHSKTAREKKVAAQEARREAEREAARQGAAEREQEEAEAAAAAEEAARAAEELLAQEGGG